MARQKGLIKLEGTLDDITFYKGSGANGKKEHLAKTKSAIPADRIANDPAFARTRENNAEFGRSAGYGKLLRRGLAKAFSIVGNARAASRFTQIMRSELGKDTVNPRGERVVQNTAVTGLLDLELNDTARMSDILYQKISATDGSGGVVINVQAGGGTVPASDLAYPIGATGYQFMAHFCALDFATNEVKATGDLPLTGIEAIGTDVTFTGGTLGFLLASTIASGDAYLVAVSVRFFQTVNGVDYPLNNDSYKAAKIVGVGVK